MQTLNPITVFHRNADSNLYPPDTQINNSRATSRTIVHIAVQFNTNIVDCPKPGFDFGLLTIESQADQYSGCMTSDCLKWLLSVISFISTKPNISQVVMAMLLSLTCMSLQCASQDPNIISKQQG